MPRTLTDRVENLETTLTSVRTGLMSTRDEVHELKQHYQSLVKQLEQRLEYVHNVINEVNKPKRR